MNAAKLREVTKVVIADQLKERKEKIERRLRETAYDGKFRALFYQDRNPNEYDCLVDGYAEELRNRGFTVNRIGNPLGFEISWENAK